MAKRGLKECFGNDKIHQPANNRNQRSEARNSYTSLFVWLSKRHHVGEGAGENKGVIDDRPDQPFAGLCGGQGGQVHE